MSLDIVEIVMALEEVLGVEACDIDSETTLGDLHWVLVTKARLAKPPRRSADEIWSMLAHILEENGVPPGKIKPQTRIVDLLQD
jgi:hypothetical protein